MDADPSGGLCERSVTLRDQGAGQRNHVKKRTGLINQRTDDHETGRNAPLAQSAPGTGTQSHAERAVSGEKTADRQQRRGRVGPADGPAGNDLRGWDQGEQYREK